MPPPPVHTASLQLAGTTCTFETGRLARQASGAVLARCGDLVVLATVVGARQARADAGFFPLTVEYREKLAAAGRIPGNYNRREGRITDQEILISRMIDRTLRSLFDDDYRAEVQIQVTVLSADPAVDTTTLALLAACAAIHISPIPCKGPASGLRILRVDGSFVAFPHHDKRAAAELDFVVSAGPDGLVMVEGEARELSETDCADAMQQALLWLQKCRNCLDQLAEVQGTSKWPGAAARPQLELPKAIQSQLAELLHDCHDKAARRQAVQQLRSEYLETVGDQPGQAEAFEAARIAVVRRQIIDGRRPDGRRATEIRPIWSEAGWLPRNHGSAIFTRGETQALVSCTLGSPEDALRSEGLAGRSEDRFILHYSFPPYSVGETRPLRGPGRREIGHGNLARRGLANLLPAPDQFPYTIRIDSEISESNGSSSMATVCGASLAMFQAGVPMTRAVAGIAMGMVADGERSVVLSDIVGEEDHLGDMDFKVVGTEQGITALQLDNKLGGLDFASLTAALQQAGTGRRHILAEMRRTIAEPAREMPANAPRVSRVDILPESVGALVGPRGATIKELQASTGARINVNDHGTVLIYASEGPSADRARRRVLQLVGVPELEHFYNGVVTGVKDFGAFVKINEICEGLVAKDQIAETFVERPSEILQEGTRVVVQVLGVDDRGRLQLSIRQALGVDPARIDY